MLGPRSSSDGEAGFAWVTFTDPDGNEFCVSAHEHSAVPLEA